MRFLHGVVAFWRHLSIGDLLVSNILHARINKRFITTLKDAMVTGNYDEVFVDFTQCIKPVLIARTLSGKNLRVTSCLHDVYAQKFLRRPGIYSRVLHGVLCQSELAVLQDVDDIRLLSAKDESIVRSFYSLKQTAVAEFAAPSWSRRVIRGRILADAPTLICYGNFNRRENADSALFMVKTVLPIVRRTIPNCQLKLLGTGSVEFHRKYALPNHVVALGFVDDPSGAFSECACVVAPLSMGAGVKFKVLDALAANVPVIGTVVAFEGIEPSPLMIETSLQDFASTVLRVLSMWRAGAEPSARPEAIT